MIIGIGCDVVEHGTSNDLNWGSDSRILDRIFSPKEIDVYISKNDTKYLSGRFAAKEAILKCLGTGMQDGIALTDIQILQSIEGRPILELFRKVKKISDEKGINFWHISISHSTGYSVAFAIAERRI